MSLTDDEREAIVSFRINGVSHYFQIKVKLMGSATISRQGGGEKVKD